VEKKRDPSKMGRQDGRADRRALERVLKYIEKEPSAPKAECAIGTMPGRMKRENRNLAIMIPA
jgi:hypothetical protein